MNNKRKIAIAASALAAFASIGLISNQASASDTTPVTTPTISSPILPLTMPSADAPEAGSNAPDGDNVQSGDQTGSDVAGALGETDGLDVQSGDQNTADVAGATDAESNN